MYRYCRIQAGAHVYLSNQSWQQTPPSSVHILRNCSRDGTSNQATFPSCLRNPGTYHLCLELRTLCPVEGKSQWYCYSTMHYGGSLFSVRKAERHGMWGGVQLAAGVGEVIKSPSAFATSPNISLTRECGGPSMCAEFAAWPHRGSRSYRRSDIAGIYLQRLNRLKQEGGPRHALGFQRQQGQAK